MGLGGEGGAESKSELGNGLGSDGHVHAHAQQVKKRGFFAKFGSDNDAGAGAGAAPVENGSGTGTAMSRFLPTLGGRKRAQSGGQGAELGVMPGVGAVERVGGVQGVEV